jgi:uncharacterized membrane protein
MPVTEQHASPTVWDRLVDRLWPLTLGIGILMTVLVFAFLVFSFSVVFHAAFSILINSETWLHEQ